MGLLDGKVAIVTGSGHGIGRGEALELAAEGAKVVVNDLGASLAGDGTDKRPADEVVELIRTRGGEAVSNYDDIADWAGAKAVVNQAVESFGGLDVLVNNAGILRDRMIVSMTEDDFDSVVRVHLKGTLACTHHAAVYWRERSKSGEQPSAAIVNTVSSAGLQGNVGQAAYGSAKAAIAALTVIASLELARYGVRANAICPGGMTRMTGTILGGGRVLREPDEYTEFDPVNPANSAPTVAWLASDDARHVTGQVFRAIGNTIAQYLPWSLGPSIESPEGQAKWNAADIGPAINTFIFGSRAAGLQMARAMADSGLSRSDATPK